MSADLPLPSTAVGGREPSLEVAKADTGQASRYVARILQQHLVDDPGGRFWTASGTAAFVDISGFTKLSERLARKGREGSGQIVEQNTLAEFFNNPKSERTKDFLSKILAH